MDKLIINGLQVSTRMGIHAWEQKILQPVIVDIEIPIDCAACGDDIDKTVDYDKLCQFVANHLETNSYKLIEHAAHSIAELIKTTFQVSQIEVSISKPHAVSNPKNVKVVVVR